MRLVSTETACARGLRDAAQTATFGQRYMWDIIKSLEPNDEHLNINIALAPPARMNVDEAMDLLRRLWSRHDSFRTRFDLDGSGQLYQDVRSRVDFPVYVWKTRTDLSRKDVLNALSDSLGRRFEVAQHAQARGAIVVRDSQVSWIAMSLSHMVSDGWGNIVLRRELRTLAAGHQVRPVTDLVHPLDHKHYELSARGRRANEAAQEYWLRCLRDFPSTYPGEGTRPRERPRYRVVSMQSAEGAVAARAAAARFGVSPAAVVATAFTELLGRLSNLAHVPFLMRTRNRQHPELLESVGHYAQRAPVVISTPVADMRSVLGQMLVAERHGFFDPVELAHRIAQTWPEVATRPSLNMTINHVPSPGGEPPDYTGIPAKPTILARDGREEEHVTLYLDVGHQGTNISLFVDTTFISSEEATARLLGLHARVVELAQGGT